MELKKKNQECRYYKQGRCNKGDKCEYLHLNPPMNTSSPYPQDQPCTSTQNQESHICRHFLKDACTRANCAYFHGYLEKLEFVYKIENHQKDILDLIYMDDTKFLSSDSNLFCVRMINDPNQFFNYEANEKEYKIGKIAFSNNKVILAMEKQTM